MYGQERPYSARDRRDCALTSRDTIGVAMAEPFSTPSGRRRPKLLFLVTEDWYFCSHRLPVARAARDAGFDVVVATRVQDHGAGILAEGLTLRALAWRRRGDGIAGSVRAIAAIARLYRSERPDILHHVALKPVLFGSLARAFAFGYGRDAPAVIDAVMGLGSAFSATSIAARLRRLALGLVLRFAAGRRPSQIIVQNPEDGAALSALGVERSRISLIGGSGVDVQHFTPLPMPKGNPVVVALVSRMLRDKGVVDAVAAIRRLRQRNLPIELVLAGPPDPDNSGSLSEAELLSLAAEPGVTWLRRSRGCSRGLATRGHRRPALDLWRGCAEGIARSRCLCPADHRERCSRLPRGGPDGE